MKNLSITYSGNKSSNEDIKDFEQKNKIKLPSNFLELFEEYEGCAAKEDTYQDKYTVQVFLPLKSKRNPSIEKIFDVYLEENNTDQWLPFATDPGGWVFCMSLAEDTYGQIFVDRFGLGEENPFEFIAASLEEFINGLEAEE